MKSIKILLFSILLCSPAFTQVGLMPNVPSTQKLRTVTDPTMIMQPGRSKIELFPEKRAQVVTNSAGIRVMTEKASLQSAKISRDQPVLVFNHAYQQFGYATGEIAFKFKGEKSLSTVKSIVSGAEAVGNQFYVVNVQTPAAILSVTKQLKARSDIDWVIPTVRYLPLSNDALL